MAPSAQAHHRSHSLLLLQKLLNLRDTASPLTFILDTLEQSAAPLVQEFIIRAKVSPSLTLLLLHPRILTFPFTDQQSQNHPRVPRNSQKTHQHRRLHQSPRQIPPRPSNRNSLTRRPRPSPSLESFSLLSISTKIPHPNRHPQPPPFHPAPPANLFLVYHSPFHHLTHSSLPHRRSLSFLHSRKSLLPFPLDPPNAHCNRRPPSLEPPPRGRDQARKRQESSAPRVGIKRRSGRRVSRPSIQPEPAHRERRGRGSS